MTIPTDGENFEIFHKEVIELSKELPTSFFSRLFRYLTPWSLNESNFKALSIVESISQHVHEILDELPDDLRHATSLQKALEDKNFVRHYPKLSKEKLEIFYRDMNTVFKEIYPLIEVIPFSKTNRMPKDIQEYFSKELKELRSEKLRYSALPATFESEQHQIKRRLSKGNLSVGLGHGVAKNKGASGTLIILDVNGKPLGVHKVSEKDIPISTRLINFAKSIFGQLSYLSRKYLAQPKSERAAYLLSKQLGFNIAPPSSKDEKISGIEGVFQIFISRKKDLDIVADVKSAENVIKEKLIQEKSSEVGKAYQSQGFFQYPPGKNENTYMEAEDVLIQIDSKKTFTSKELIIFQKFAIFDYIIGNLDRHRENWLLTVSPEGEITDIKGIDNANAFPKKQPSKNSLAARNQYEWKSLNLAQQKFTPETVNFVKENLKSEKIHEFIENLKNDMPGYLELEMESLIYERALVIFHLVQKDSVTPADLASYSTNEEIHRFIANF